MVRLWNIDRLRQFGYNELEKLILSKCKNHAAAAPSKRIEQIVPLPSDPIRPLGDAMCSRLVGNQRSVRQYSIV